LMQDDAADFLQAPLGPEMEEHLDHLDRDAAAIAAQAEAAKVPWAVVILPDGPQAAMVSTGEWPAGIDPYALGRRIQPIVAKLGGLYVDILPYYRRIPNPETGFFRVNGHPNELGHRIFSTLIADQLTGGAIPALSAGAGLRTSIGGPR